MRIIIPLVSVAAFSLGLGGCDQQDEPEEGFVGGTEESLGPIEAILDPIARTVWPGNVQEDGHLQVRMINGFFNGAPTAYWFLGFASRLTADVFWFCREGDTACPIDDRGVVAWDRVVGSPVFARVPGEAGFAPFWFTWVVHVPPDYEPNDLKSVLGIEAAVKEGTVKVERLIHDYGGDVGPDEVIMHCLLVLEGTTLERNGEEVIGRPGVKSLEMLTRKGWHKRYQINFIDFTPSEGVLVPDPSTEARPIFPASDIYVMFRDCENGSEGRPCERTSGELGAVSERGTEVDLTSDGDKRDTNNVIVAFPGQPPETPEDPAYSPLWRVNVVPIPKASDDNPALRLIDQTGDQNDTVIKRVGDIREFARAGVLLEPRPISETQAGNAIDGNDGKVFFNCPSQVADE